MRSPRAGLAAIGVALALVCVGCAPYYTTKGWKRTHPDSLAGEWHETGAAYKMRLWADGHCGPCGLQSCIWDLELPDTIRFSSCFSKHFVRYHMTPDGELVIEDDGKIRHYRRVANLTTCGDKIEYEPIEQQEAGAKPSASQ